MAIPKVTVVIPAYNHERYVGETIQSVLGQTFQDFELIIINDGSTDNTEAEILKFKDNRVRYYSQENRGLSATLNRGIELAMGEYFNFLPSDDVFSPEKLEIQLKIFQKEHALGLVFAYPCLIDAEGKEIKVGPAAQWAIVPYETKEEILPALFERNFFSAPSALIRMECFKRVGQFDESLKTVQDYDMWMRILKYYDLRLIKKPLVKYRWHGANLTYQPTSETELERAKVLLKAYKDLMIEDIFPSLRQRGDALSYAEAYEKLALYMEKSDLPAFLPISQMCKERGRSFRSSALNCFEYNSNNLSPPPSYSPPPLPSPLEGKGFGDGKIHILFETLSLDKGGMEEVIYSLIVHLNPAFFYPVVVCIQKGGYTADRIKRLGVPVEILGEQKEKEYVEILNRYQIDLVNAHFSLFGSSIADQHGIPVISVLQNIYNWYSGGILDEFRRVDPWISKYIAVSKQVASFFNFRFNIDPGRIQTIPNGISIDRFKKEDPFQKLNRRDLGWNQDDFIFLHVGAITPAKMPNLIIAAMKEISKIQPNIKLISLGPELDAEYHSFIQKKVEESHLAEQIKFMGFSENLTPYYHLADAFLLPSLIEGWALAILEAMYHGLPLILTKVGGAEELVEDQDIGILIENCCGNLFQLSGSDLEYYSHLEHPQNTPELIEAMLQFFQNQNEWREKAKKGKEKILSHYTWDKIIPQYEREFITSAWEGRRIKESHLKKGLRDLKKRLDEQDKEIDRLRQIEGKVTQLTTELQERFHNIDHQLNYIVARLSVRERMRGFLFKYLKKIHTYVPKKMREKYRFQYRRFFFNRLFPDKERFEHPTHSLNSKNILSNSKNILSEEEVGRFLKFVQKGDFQKLFVIYTTDPYVESRGQRSTWLAKEFAKRALPVIFFYWRWDQKEKILKSLNPNILSVPIDEFSKVEKQLFPFSSDRLKKVFLIEFPDSSLFEKVNIANVNSFVTVYDCIDDWEQFAKVGQAVWYDVDVERYLLRNVDLVIATNPILAEKLRQMGTDYVPIIPNGVEMASLQQKQGLMKNIERGVLTIGYFGHLTESWFDWDLVLRTARTKKDWIFHIIGYGEPSGLKLPENVKFWGKVEHEDLPFYTRSWDVAIIPFKEGKLSEAVDPIKLYEYLYLGLPVVAVNMPHLQGTPGVFPCRRDDFEKALLLAKETPLDHGEVERFIQNSTWEKRVDRILEEIDKVDLSKNILKGIG